MNNFKIYIQSFHFNVQTTSLGLCSCLWSFLCFLCQYVLCIIVCSCLRVILLLPLLYTRPSTRRRLVIVFDRRRFFDSSVHSRSWFPNTTHSTLITIVFTRLLNYFPCLWYFKPVSMPWLTLVRSCINVHYCRHTAIDTIPNPNFFWPTFFCFVECWWRWLEWWKRMFLQGWETKDG